MYLKKKMTVPTHMWTEFVCFKENPQPEISSRISFIGLNYRTGVVKLYDQGIYDTLEKMYENSKLGQITPGNYMRNLKDMRPTPLASKPPAEGSDLRIKICEPNSELLGNPKDLFCRPASDRKPPCHRSTAGVDCQHILLVLRFPEVAQLTHLDVQ